MKMQKMVSLDPETAKIAKQMTNFSGWVRRMLKLRASGTDQVALYRKFIAIMAAVDNVEDEEVRSSIFADFETNKKQKRLGEFE